VFFYSPISHVGIYIGDGNMIHASNPSKPVAIAPIDYIPYSGAVRP
jgi:cell wall-associated NlpC family hydrolase